MGRTDDDDTVFHDIQMPLAQGRELVQLVTTLNRYHCEPTDLGPLLSVNRLFENGGRAE